MQTETATVAVKYEVDESIKVENLDPYSNKVDYDKFYTKEAVAIDCLRSIDLEEYDLVVTNKVSNKRMCAICCTYKFFRVLSTD